MALTDVGKIYGASHCFKVAQETDIKPIIGCRIHVDLESSLYSFY
ncbi:hypothetical protein [Desulfonatronum thioautotrophicum]